MKKRALHLPRSIWIWGEDGYFDGRSVKTPAQLKTALDHAHATIARFTEHSRAARALVIEWDENQRALRARIVAQSPVRSSSLATQIRQHLATIGLSAKGTRLASKKKAPEKKASKKAHAKSAVRVRLGEQPFALGTVAATPGALATFSRQHITGALDLYESRSWGNPPVTSRKENERNADRNRGRISAAYHFKGLRGSPTLWIITEGGPENPPRRTTLLLPEEY